MWKVKVLKTWFELQEGEVTVLPDHAAMRLAGKGKVKLIRHFKWKVIENICHTCKHKSRGKIRVYSDEK